MSPRDRLLILYGAGTRPCLDGANNWLGCTWCYLPCILHPGGTKAIRYSVVVQSALPEVVSLEAMQEQPKPPKPKGRPSRGWHAYPVAGSREPPKKAVG